ncbi:hypothetical protein DFJ74DRAFT_681047 [Hyaloraphidium curvatum]|nr:hypothetical protein DFJ74DRAFT_681047 [Hyaloraphidium curvatum]
MSSSSRDPTTPTPPPSSDAPTSSVLDELDRRTAAFFRAAHASALSGLRSLGVLPGTSPAAEPDADGRKPPPAPSGWPGRTQPADRPPPASQVDPRAYDRPYFPLAGAPATAEERKLLADAQAKDRADQQEAFLSPANRLRRMDPRAGAAENCADLEFEYRKCLWRGPWRERWKGCAALDAAWQGCLMGQAEILEEMGFADKRRSSEELGWILEEADRRWLQGQAAARAEKVE